MRRRVPDVDAPWILLAVLGSVAVTLFDLARKTVFLGASWNYEYPPWEFVYDPLALGALVVASLAIILSVERLAELDRNRFLAVLLCSTVALSVLAFFATPEKSYRWALTPDVPGPVESFQYYPATIAAEDGLVAYFSNFHSAPTLNGADRIETTQYLTEQLRGADYFPWNDTLADYASEIVTQRHGPVPGLLVAPFLFVLGSDPVNAVIGSYAITLTLPLLTYFLFRPYFDERQSRLGSLFVALSPAYLIYQRYGTVSYDAITAVVVTSSVVLFLYACRTDRRSLLALSGVAFSGAMLSKISILTAFAAFVVLIVVYADDIRDGVSNLATFCTSTLLVPLALLPLGYNFVVQYMYDVARILASDGASSSNPTFAWLLAVYNVRLLGAVILTFAALFAGSVLVERRVRGLSERDYVSVAFLLPTLPFLALRGITLSRHLLPLLPMVVFVGLWGVHRWTGRQLSAREAQVALGATLLLALVNL